MKKQWKQEQEFKAMLRDVLPESREEVLRILGDITAIATCLERTKAPRIRQPGSQNMAAPNAGH